VIKEDYWGNRDIVTVVQPGETFAESYACSLEASVGVSVQASQNSEVLLMDIRRVMQTCSSACAFHSRLIRNLVTLLASRNLRFNEKLTHVMQRRTRDKILSYLSSESQKQKTSYFDIPFDRQQLADYLGVDRSALSSELSAMKKEKILDYEKNHFMLNKDHVRQEL